jgi:hypothetical protein
MKGSNKRTIVALATIGVVLSLAAVVAMINRREKVDSWNEAAEGFLAIATPCCTRASLWDALDTVTPDGQQARPASAAEAAQWLDDWPYGSREEPDRPHEAQLSVGIQNTEVRCVGPPTGADIPQRRDDEETLEALRHRRECVYTKWKVWSAESADEHLNERHTIWADDDGLFHGRVDYWQPE